jgi:hypothetical protein
MYDESWLIMFMCEGKLKKYTCQVLKAELWRCTDKSQFFPVDLDPVPKYALFSHPCDNR